MNRQAKRSSLVQRELQWRDRMKRQAESGLSVKAFCQRESISSWAFYQWRARLAQAGKHRQGTSAAAPGAFIDLSAVDRSPAPGVDGRWRGAERFEIKLELGGGVVLHVARH
jgi:putative transposase